jgi:hypothetical protein
MFGKTTLQQISVRLLMVTINWLHEGHPSMQASNSITGLDRP